jgi:hypothetical protein
MASGVGREPASAHIAFPVHCDYLGGNSALGHHGHHLWITDGRIGHGELRLTHGIPLSDVLSVEVDARDGGGVDAQTLLSFGAVDGGMRFAHPPAVITDVTVRSRDGQEAAWVVEERDVRWVRERLAPALLDAGIPFYGDPVPPGR